MLVKSVYLYGENFLALLTTLSIQNYALIDDVTVSFSPGFTTITGETGAGKSILLGALSLVLGKRAALTSLKDNAKKCVIEAEFDLSRYTLERFFQENDLDYETHTLLRREILPSGKSRAFVNDSPVTLDILKALGTRLVDIHSQHETLQLTENDFQLKVIDALAGNAETLQAYTDALEKYRKACKTLAEWRDSQTNATKEYEYNSFLLQELEAAALKTSMQEELEAEYEQLTHVEQILEQLSLSDHLLNDEQTGILGKMAHLKKAFQTLSSFSPACETLKKRLESLFIETDDLATEMAQLQEGIEANPERLEAVNTQLQRLYALQKKHQVSTVEELLRLKAQLSERVATVENTEAELEKKEAEVAQLTTTLEAYALKLREARQAVLPNLKTQLQESLAALGMPSATFKIEVNPSPAFTSRGKDVLVFLFSANKGSSYDELKKVASGGELSRIMLTIKSILARYEHLPTLIFDEIDTGVSGEISNRMGDIMEQMSQSLQIFSITHLPQVASKGKEQFKVYKEEGPGGISTHIKALNPGERVAELAEMLGGKTLSPSAIAHAKQLLK